MKRIFHVTIGTSFVVIGIALLVVFSMISSSFEAQGVFLCEAVSSNPTLDMAQCPAHTSDVPMLVTIGTVFGVLVLLGGIIVLSLTQKKHIEKVVETKKRDFSTLADDERKICELLEAQNGSMYQSDLIKHLDVSKVTMTRLLDHLEHDLQLVERKRRGMTNIVVLR